jgi:arylsulfatase A-like enzyme
VTQADVAPTLRALAGLEWPAPQQGAALTAPLRRDAVMLEYYAKQKWVNPIRTIRTRRWKLNRYDSGDRELYDLETDPAEVRNLAGTAPARATEQQLARRIEAWRGTL